MNSQSSYLFRGLVALSGENKAHNLTYTGDYYILMITTFSLVQFVISDSLETWMVCQNYKNGSISILSPAYNCIVHGFPEMATFWPGSNWISEHTIWKTWNRASWKSDTPNPSYAPLKANAGLFVRPLPTRDCRESSILVLDPVLDSPLALASSASHRMYKVQWRMGSLNIQVMWQAVGIN